jgi:peptidase E
VGCVTAETPTIIATSIGFESMGLGAGDWRAGPVYRLAADAARAGEHPRLCIVDSAGGDNPASLVSMYAAFGRAGFVTTHLALYPQPNAADVRAHLLAQDIIWVAGGSVANLLAVWQTHGLGAILEEAWRAGVVLMGVSAGSLCWFVGGTTDSFGLPLHAVHNGLGLLPYSNSPHHDAEPERRPTITRLLAEGALPECYASDNGVALVFHGTELHEAVTQIDGAKAWHLVRRDDGSVQETALPTRLLTDAN